MIFGSDNWASVTPTVAARLTEAMADHAPGYGSDSWTAAAEAAIAAWFEHEVAVFFVATGSAANSLALAHASRPGGVAFCHADAHLAADEAGAPSFLGGGLVLERVPGPLGRIDPDGFREKLALYPEGVVHHGQPVALSITNVTEYGTCYAPAEVAALAGIAKARGMSVHMDGARFANALAHLGCSPADLTWRAGVDALSLGFTKAGCGCAEAVGFFDRARGVDFD
jgi:threonine aldolase